jgi:hypothetical protein
MYEDPIVDEVRKTREHLAEKHNFDVGAIFEDLRKRQGTLGKRLVRRERKQIAEQAAAPDRNSAALHPGR